MKNIPFTNESNYKLKLMEKIEMVIKRMRWKVHTMDKDEDNVQPTYGLKTSKCPPQVKELIPFENDLIDLVKKITFDNRIKNSSSFQKTLQNDIRSIKSSSRTLTPADKTSNMYRLTREQHEKLVHDSVTSTYKKTDNKIQDVINKQGKCIAEKTGVVDKMNINGKSNCFVSLKDHKDNFLNKPTVRLINPAKNEIGRISKNILDNINVKLRNILGTNQWKNTRDVIKWFQGIQNKEIYKFTMFDIKDFYPSIKEDLLNTALEFAANHVNISTDDREIIHHARKSLLFNKNETWIKKSSNTFDVTMGAYDGAEVCELVGTYLLYLISKSYKKEEVGLYRDDGLAVFKNISGPKAEKIKKHFQRIFKEHGLDIVIDCNLKIVNYLDVTLNLNDGSYRPYCKPNDITSYIHKESNHPPNVIKQLPIAIEKRVSELSSSEEIFNQSKGYYEKALENSGYNYELKYSPNTQDVNQNKRRRKRKIIWFNPPFSKNVTTKVATYFNNLVKKHFPPSHKFGKLFNKNNLKISYSCMPNIMSVINAHNKKIIANPSTTTEKMCNCRRKEDCPLNGRCLEREILYEGTITSNLPNYGEKRYLGITENTFKKRYANHKKSFNHDTYKNDTELSSEYWKIKESGYVPKITWKIVRKYPSYNPETKRCLLCLGEKLEIVESTSGRLLNKRDEVVSKCRHRNKYSLGKFDSND